VIKERNMHLNITRTILFIMIGWLLVVSAGCADIKAVIDMPKNKRIDTIRQDNRALVNQGQYEQVLTNLKAAVQQYPQADGLWYDLGKAHYGRGQHQAAVQAFSQARIHKQEYFHSFWEATEWRGWAYLQLGQYEKAIVDFDFVLTYKPQNHHCREGKGWAYCETGDYDKALQEFDAGLKIDPKQPMLLRRKAWTLYYQKDYAEAEKVFRQAIGVFGKQDTGLVLGAYRGLGKMGYERGNFDVARKDLTRAIELASTQQNAGLPQLYVWKALCYAGLDDKETAIALMDRAIKAGQGHPEVTWMLAVAAYGCGQPEKAWNLLGGQGRIGVACQDLEAKEGVRVGAVTEGQAAEQAGLLSGDLIVRVNDQKVTESSQLIRLVLQLSPGDEVNIGIVREGMDKEISLEVGSVEADINQDELLAPLQTAKQDELRAVEQALLASQVIVAEEVLPSAEASPPPAVEKPSGPSLELDSVIVDPEQVMPGDSFDVVLDFIVNDPEAKEGDLTVTMKYAVSQNGKVLKQFKAKDFQVPNKEYWTLTRQPKAAKVPGQYNLDVILTYKDLKATGQATFTIQ